MINRYIYIIFLLSLGCDVFIEESSPLGGQFYIQDGWLSFEAGNFDQACSYFSTSISTNDENISDVNFFAYTGLGWANMYKAKFFDDISDKGFVDSSGHNFDLAYEMFLNIDDSILQTFEIISAKMNLFAGLAIQRAYFAKEKSVNTLNWESVNVVLDSTIRKSYEQVVDYSREIDDDFIFQYDENITFKELLILRIESLILLGYIDDAILEYKELIKIQTGIEVQEECDNGISSQNLAKCLCIISHDGFCPFDS
jgi:tetratricopeptide (TPR) repeat protein